MKGNHMWLLREQEAAQMRSAIAAGRGPTAAEQEAYEVKCAAEASAVSTPRILSIAGKTAELRIEGVLTPKPDLFARWFGGSNTAYSEINAALGVAASDPNVRDLIMVVDSPGGAVAGLFDTLAAIQAFPKPIRVEATCACSGAYALAAVAGKITARNASASFGSVGVVVTFADWADVDITEITSTEAPNKRPDYKTDEGKAVIRAYLDEIHALFAAAIAEGRSHATGETVSPADVNTNYGRGSVMLAKSAKLAGMIDGLAKAPARSQTTAATAIGTAAPQRKGSTMDLGTLKAQHRDVYDAAFAEGQAAAIAEERDRVGAHIALGTSSGAMDIALEAITSGQPLNQTLTAKYFAAGMGKREAEESKADSDAAANAAAGATPNPVIDASSGDAYAASVLALLEAEDSQ